MARDQRTNATGPEKTVLALNVNGISGYIRRGNNRYEICRHISRLHLQLHTALELSLESNHAVGRMSLWLSYLHTALE